MARPENWRVRVNRVIESWVEVPAATAAAAELEAAKIPGVVSVFAKSAISAKQIVAPAPPAGVQEE